MNIQPATVWSACLLAATLPAAGAGAQTVTGVATFENVGVEVAFPAAPADGTTIEMAVREASGGGAYRIAHPLSRIDADRFAGSLFRLEPGTAYAIRLSSAAFPSNLIVAVRTREAYHPGASLRTLHVSPGGNDLHNGLTAGTAFQTVAHALSVLRAGDRVLLHQGRYYEGDLDIGTSGRTDAPIAIEAAPGERPVIDGTDTSFVPAWTVFDPGGQVYRTPCAVHPRNAYLNGGQFYHYEQLPDLLADPWGQSAGYSTDGAYLYARFPDGAPPGTNRVTIPRQTTGITLDSIHDVRIKGIEFCYFGRDLYHRAIYIDGGDSNLVEHCLFHHNGIGVALKRAANGNVIQHCRFDESPADTFAWSAVKDGGTDYESGGVVVYGSSQANSGNVIRYNHFEHLFDGAHLYSEDIAGPTRNLDFHDNIVLHCGDDGLETDGAGVNNRIYDNLFSDFLTGISVAPCAIGPTYIFRNVLSGWHSAEIYEGYPFKFNVSSPLTIDWVYLYHNTCWTDVPGQDGFLFKNYSNWRQVVSRNNIYAGTDYALENWSSVNPVDFDYDALSSTHPERFIRWNGTSYATIGAFVAATGQEPNGRDAEPRFRDATALDFRLRGDCPLIDGGIAIPGVNDDYVGPAPDIGALEFAHQATDLHLADDLVRISWDVATGTTYRLESSADLANRAWTGIGPDAVATGTTLWLNQATTGANAGFYRSTISGL